MSSKFNFTLTLTRPMLGTNPANAAVMDAHILDRQRKLISDNSRINTKINKYLDAVDITPERKQQELDLVIARVEEMAGKPFDPEQRAQLIAGTLDDLKETFAELDTKGTTIFFKDPKTGRPMIGDHMIYGFLKAAAEAIGRTLPRKSGTVLNSISYTQSLINQHVRCEDRFIVFDRDLVKDANGKSEYLQRSLRADTAQGPRISLAKSEIVPDGAFINFTLKIFPGSPIKEEHLKQMFDYGEYVGLGQWRSAGWGMFTYVMEEL